MTSSPPRTRHRFINFVLAVTSAVAVSLLLAVSWTAFQPKLQAHVNKARLLRELQSVQALKLHFKVKRDTMRVHGWVEFNALAIPVVNGQGDSQIISFNGVASFSEGATSHKYMLVDGVAYFTAEVDQMGIAQESVTCLNASSLPPIHEVLEGINSATHVAAVDGNESVACPAGSLLKFTFAEDDYALCAFPPSGEPGFDIYGSDLDIQVRYTETNEAIVAPAVSDEMKAACERVPDATTLPSSTVNLLTGNDFISTLMDVNEERMSLFSSSCGCKGGVVHESSSTVSIKRMRSVWWTSWTTGGHQKAYALLLVDQVRSAQHEGRGLD